VLGDGRIRLEIEAEVSTIANANVAGVGNPNIVAPSFNVNRIHTTVEMGNGESFALGGLLENQVVATTSKVPVLGDLPFFGAAWRQVNYREREIEVLVMVTPRLVDALDCSQRVTKLPGQETRTPTDFELFLEGILEAPRGPRDLAPDGCYRAAHWWSGPFCDPPRGCLAGPGNGGCSSCGNGGSFGLPGGCSGCGTMPMAPVGAPMSSRPAMPPMAVPTDAPASTTSSAKSGETVSRAVMLTPEPVVPMPRDGIVPTRSLQPPEPRLMAPGGTPAKIE
jgi:pilus assembly protein CpaC